MKEATGELNMTVVTVVAIAAIVAIFYAFVWPSMKANMIGSTACANGPRTVIGTNGQEGFVRCEALQPDGTYKCVYFQDGKNGQVTCRQK